MIDPYNVVLAAHILLIVTWLGMDTGVFASSFWVASPKYSIETRIQMGRLLGILDMGPRTSLLLILALGLLMATWRWGLFAGLGPAGPILTGVLMLILLFWLWCVWQQYLVRQALIQRKDVGRKIFFARGFTTIDLYARITLAIVLIVAGIGSLIPGLVLFTQFAWLDIKIALFGGIILCGVGIRFASAAFEHSLGDVIRLVSTGQGESPERTTAEESIRVSLNRTRPWVLALWALIVLITFIAVTKPFGA